MVINFHVVQYSDDGSEERLSKRRERNRLRRERESDEERHAR